MDSCKRLLWLCQMRVMCDWASIIVYHICTTCNVCWMNSVCVMHALLIKESRSLFSLCQVQFPYNHVETRSLEMESALSKQLSPHRKSLEKNRSEIQNLLDSAKAFDMLNEQFNFHPGSSSLVCSNASCIYRPIDCARLVMRQRSRPKPRLPESSLTASATFSKRSDE